jgi:VanZ family protein
MLAVRHPRLWLVSGWMLVVGCLYLSLVPASALPQTGVSDKVEHSLAYAVLALWFAGLYPRSRYGIIGIGLFAMGVAVEWAQGAMHMGRQSDYHDVIANTIGIVAGLGLALLWLGGWVERIDGWARGRESTRRD